MIKSKYAGIFLFSQNDFPKGIHDGFIHVPFVAQAVPYIPLKKTASHVAVHGQQVGQAHEGDRHLFAVGTDLLQYLIDGQVVGKYFCGGTGLTDFQRGKSAFIKGKAHVPAVKKTVDDEFFLFQLLKKILNVFALLQFDKFAGNNDPEKNLLNNRIVFQHATC